MKKLCITAMVLLITGICFAQSPVGRWKKTVHTSEFNGQRFDSHKALLTQRPCAAKIAWDIRADGAFRLDAASSGCDESYRNIQEKLYSKTKWKLEGDRILISATNFSISQVYLFFVERSIAKSKQVIGRHHPHSSRDITSEIIQQGWGIRP